MDPKEYITNKTFCPIPWTGFMYNSNGDVMNCIRSQRPIGNLLDNSIHDILAVNTQTKKNMLERKKGLGCDGCYNLEEGKNSFDIISDRIFYLKELKEVKNTLYDNVDQFDLYKIDIRWSNVCNFACVYCSPEYSSKWASELKIQITQPNQIRVQEMKDFIFEKADQLKHVYLAGGEPLLMKENLELLLILKKVNPNVNLRVNTNLSKVDTRVFETICEFTNVHWIISIDELELEFEYIRYGSKWEDFLDNLKIVRNLKHKVSFNMLHHLLNYMSIFDCVRYLQNLGFHNNSFIIGPIETPSYMSINHLPDHMLHTVEQELIRWISQKPKFLLENSLRNMLQYIKTPSEKNINYCLEEIAKLDNRRGTDSRQIFKEFYNQIEGK
jgi:sulfatase maturation enzyme AslB (radical SAM superfamily)